MKKVLYVIALLAACFLAINSVSAKTTMTGLKETVQEELATFSGKEGYEEYVERMEDADLSNYSESDDKVNVYIFRGNTCWHCLDEISWFASVTKEYGKYFNVKTYEVYENSSNNKLMSLVAKQFGETSGGVPFTVIGKRTWSGFGEGMGDEMLKVIQDIYNSGNVNENDIKNKIDLEEGTVIGNNNKEKSNTGIIIALLAVVLIGGIVLIYFVSKSK